MTWLEWALGFMLLSLYITCLFTVCSMTFQKGRTVLGIVGIFAPWLWLIGAFLPAKKGSRYELAQQAAGQRPVAQPAPEAPTAPCVRGGALCRLRGGGDGVACARLVANGWEPRCPPSRRRAAGTPTRRSAWG